MWWARLLNSLVALYDSGAGGGAAGDFESIATLTPTSGTSVSFTSIPSTYTHLQVRYSVMGTNFATLRMTLNSDTASNYSWHEVGGYNSSAIVDAGTSSTFADLTPYNRGLGSSQPTPGVLDILDYANTNKFKTTKALTGRNDNTSSSSIGFYSGNWRSTSAVSTVTFTSSSAFATGTSIALYGINA